MAGNGDGVDPVLVPHIVSPTKLAILAVMWDMGRVTTARELWKIWGKCKPLKVFEYHLSTLVRARVAEFVPDGRVLRFRLVGPSLPLQAYLYKK